MITPGQFIRLIGIQRVLIRHGLDEIVLSTHLFRPIRYLMYLMPWNWRRRNYAPKEERVLHALEDLGPIFVKFGQLLSTRRDLLPEGLADQLTKLQDSVPPFPVEEAKRLIEEAYDEPVDKVFLEFDEQPLASASIAQVHAARLTDGRDVVVKVVRPDIETVIKRDMGLIMILAELAEKYSEHGRRMRPVGVVEEYRKVILDELDLMREAANASQLKRNFKDSDQLYIPEIEWDLARKNVMVMERIHGIHIDESDALETAGVDRKEIAELGIEIFFTQVFRDRYFHADLHPGNLFVIPAKGGDSLQLALIDFGIMGSLSEQDQHYLANNFIAFLGRDYKRVAELHIESGWVPAGTRVDDFEFAIRSVCEPIFEKPLREISFGHLLLRLFQTAQRFHMVVLPQLLLLQKTLVNIEGVGRQLYPDLDMWETARPIMKKWMSEQTGARHLFDAARENLPGWIAKLPEIPGNAIDILEKMNKGELQVRSDKASLESLKQEIKLSNERNNLTTIASALIIAAALIFGLNGNDQKFVSFWQIPLPVWLLSISALFLLIKAWLKK
ncbi:MAG: ubiquinone biosynthesis regulatory protein kinase UbiB [Gammaproteobacteria bacterium]